MLERFDRQKAFITKLLQRKKRTQAVAPLASAPEESVAVPSEPVDINPELMAKILEQEVGNLLFSPPTEGEDVESRRQALQLLYDRGYKFLVSHGYEEEAEALIGANDTYYFNRFVIEASPGMLGISELAELENFPMPDRDTVSSKDLARNMFAMVARDSLVGASEPPDPAPYLAKMPVPFANVLRSVFIIDTIYREGIKERSLELFQKDLRPPRDSNQA